MGEMKEKGRKIITFEKGSKKNLQDGGSEN